MKKSILKPFNLSVIIIALSSFLFSFTSNWGGEGFEIYLNNKLVLQKYGKDMNTVKNLQLNQNVKAGQLAIWYYHCGRVGKDRVVSIKDSQHKIIKEWKFANNNDVNAKMICNVKEIMELPKLKLGQQVSLYYASSELPGGRLLANINVVNGSHVNP